MEEHDVCMISASHSTDAEGRPYIELFGRTRGKKSIAIAVFGFPQYYYAMDPTPALESSLNANPDVSGTEHVELEFRGKRHDCLKILFDDPWKATALRSKLSSKFKVFAGDIPYSDRYIYDADMGSCIRVRGEPVDLGYSTDVTIRLDSFENIGFFDPGLRYLSFDIENSVENGTIYCICTKVEEDGEFSTPEPIYGEEKEIIERFGRLVRDVDPDVITGYNIDNYDITRIFERAELNRMRDALPWGRDGGQPKKFSERFWRVKGRMIVDAWWAARKELRPKQETLNAVARQVLGEEKLDVDPKHMDQEWRENRAKVMEYCTQDANLALRILLSVGEVRKALDLAAVSKLPVGEVITSGTSTLVDSLLIREADRSGEAVPMNGRRTARGEDQIEGGYVHAMKAGLYHWVMVLDFKSMYPSLIIANNICFTTLADDGEIVAPSGAKYMSPERKRGLLPKILVGLMEQRDSIKKAMRSTDDLAEMRYLDGLQEAVKVVMNTFYGVFASSFYRFTDKSIGASITAFARANITTIIKQLQDDGHPVIYGDTDSVFALSPYHDIAGATKFGKEQAERFSGAGKTLEFEKLLEPMFSHGMKKRYVGRVVYPEGQTELLVRGYEIRRSDSFDLQSDMLMELFEKILDERFDEALELVRSTIRDVLAGKVDPSQLVISKGCRGLDAYANPERMANVQAARKLIAMGYDFIPGMKVSWIVTDASKAPQVVEPYVSGVPFAARPDYRYYAERLAHMASRITEVFGWSEKDLVAGSQQKTLLEDDFIQTSPKPGKPESAAPAPTAKAERKGEKPVNLDDFF